MSGNFGYREIPSGCQFWPLKNDVADAWSADEVVRMYCDGFAGAWNDEAAKVARRTAVADAGGVPFAHQACSQIKGTGAGKLSLLFPAMERLFPGCLPGPAQERGDCFVAGTIVAGVETKAIEKIRVGDEVWTAHGKLTKVVSTKKSVSYQPIVTIKPVGGIPIRCTIDHNILVYRLPKVGTVTVNKTHYEHAKAVGGEASKSLVVKRFEEREAVWVKAGEINDGDCLLTPISTQITSVDAGEFSEFTQSEQGMFALGFFAGNGHASGHSIEFTTAKLDTLKGIGEFLKSLGYTPHISKQRGAYRLRISSVGLVNWLRSEFYDKEKTKVFPAWAVGNIAFLSGLCDADGHSKDGVHKLDSTSPSIAYNARASLIALGFDPTVSFLCRSKGTFANAKPLYRLIWRNKKQRDYIWRDDVFVCSRVRKVEISEGPTEVYDIGVEDSHHSFIANGYAVHNCVSHSSRNAALASLANEVAFGKPDEVTGWYEAAPDVDIAGIKQGVLSSEYLYWWRGYNGDGWDCATAAEQIRKHGMMLRKPYPDLSLDLTHYSGKLAGKYGAQRPPETIAAVGRVHPVRTTTEIETLEELLDLIANGYGVSSCGGEGFSDTRDANGVSRRSGSWAHAMAYLGVDDRAEIKQAYGEALVLVQNSWAKWNGGPRRILGTNIDIPEGAFWAKWSDVKRRQIIAYSSIAGWPRKTLPDYGFKVLG